MNKDNKKHCNAINMFAIEQQPFDYIPEYGGHYDIERDEVYVNGEWVCKGQAAFLMVQKAELNKKFKDSPDNVKVLLPKIIAEKLIYQHLINVQTDRGITQYEIKNLEITDYGAVYGFFEIV